MGSDSFNRAFLLSFKQRLKVHSPGEFDMGLKLKACSCLLVNMTLLAAFGCNGEKKDDASNSSVSDAFLKLTDFDSTKVDSIDKLELSIQINQDSSFMANEADETSNTSEDEESCFNKKLADTVVTATQTSLTLGYQFDWGSCLMEDYSTPEIKELATLKEAIGFVKYYFKFVNANCQTNELSKYNGKKMSDLPEGDEPICNGAIPETVIMNAEITQRVLLANPATSEAIIIHTLSRSATMKADGTACDKISDGTNTTLVSDCHTIHQTIVLSDDTRGFASSYNENISRAGLASSPVATNVYYTAGKISFNIEGWKGDMTYTNGTTAPTWQATNGSATASGTYFSTEESTSFNRLAQKMLELPRLALPKLRKAQQ